MSTTANPYQAVPDVPVIITGNTHPVDGAHCAVRTGSVSGQRTAAELTHLLFPACSRYCATVEYLGCGECEAVCHQKFNRDGTAKTQNASHEP